MSKSGHVDIGAGAKIICPVTIGDRALIGTNAVVICDVPVGATAVGTHIPHPELSHYEFSEFG